jgi:predicted O-linked N-acetylglucosamine transferase (SPINDLY family)
MSDRRTATTPTGAAHELFQQGNTLFGAGDREAAAERYRRALQMEPSFAEARYNLGCVLDALAGPSQALPHFAQAAVLRPDWWQARSNLGLALGRVGRMAEAACELEAAAALNPGEAGLLNNLGLALDALGRGEEAHGSFQEAIRLDPLYPEAHNNLAILFERYGRTTEAISSCLEALRLRPDYPEAHHNLANALKSQGRHVEALAHYRETLRLRPDYAEAQSSLLFALCYPGGVTPAQVFSEHAAFGAAHRFAAAPHSNDPDPRRTLRIGYVSADFRDHAVARFIEPVLRHHDKSRFLIFCYSNVSVPEAASTRLEALAGRFTNIAGVADQDAAALIRRDRIDILVDLSGHTAGNRLALFARKPAPVQVTWLGYPQTTGLAAMDYRITDAVTDPPGESERFHSERLLRLPGNFSCFAPPKEAPAVGELPALSRGAITFGSFNNPAKITPETVALWAGALHGVPGSRMLIKGYSLADEGSRALLSGLFAARGIRAERLELQGNTPCYREHLQLYGRVDIALDCFPYNGTTTTCEALWMGLPVVTLAGGSHLSRVGASLLQSVGLGDLVAHDAQGFRDLAAGLALDLDRLAHLRGTLRGTMAASPLTDAAGFTGQLEAAFVAIWQSWCAGGLGGRADGTVPHGEPGASQGAAAPAEAFHHQRDPAWRDAASVTGSLLKYAGILLQKGMPEEARAQLQEALRRDPECSQAHYRLAVVRAAEGCPEDAARHFQEALGILPGEVKSLNGLGVVLEQRGRPEEAASCYREAVRIDPCYQDAQINLALLLKNHGRLCEAERQLEEALRVQPGAVRLKYNLANVLHFQGRSLEAVAAYREVLRLYPEHLDAQQNLLFALHYSPQFTDRQIFDGHLAAAGQKAFRPGAPLRRCACEPAPGRRIRIGYLSPDFRSHAVASFIEPILSHHDKSRFEVYCYANLARPDGTTERLMALAEGWRDICQVGDEEAARLIAADRIDILVDLAGHTSGNRLPLMALKPAPLQMTWIGYPDTTGLPEMDFRITDRLADPPGTTEQFHSERLVRLPRSFCCYLPPESSPAVEALPLRAAGRVTFGSFNNLAKVTPEVISLWARVLFAVPDSRLLMKCSPLADAAVCARIQGLFRRQGVDSGRIELHPGNASTSEHLAQYGRIDIALDTFPYNGTTTSCEALWMGVPVVTLAGTRHAARTGVSILTNCGLGHLVAQSGDEYLSIACGLARDPDNLQQLRLGLRDRMAASPLMDGATVTRELEAAFLRILTDNHS